MRSLNNVNIKLCRFYMITINLVQTKDLKYSESLTVHINYNALFT